MTSISAIETKGASAAPYLAGSIVMEGAGSKGAKPRPFNYHLAVRQFHHWAYAAATLRANAAAGVPLRMFARRRGGMRKMFETRQVDRGTMRYLAGAKDFKPSTSVRSKMVAWGYEVEEVVEPHPAMMLLANPNPNDNGYEMSVERHLDLQIAGNSWWYVPTSRIGVPALIYRLPPQWTHVKPNETKRGTNRVAGYVYGKNTANEVEFDESEVDHFRMPNPKDGGLFYGMGWYEASWLALGLHDAKRVEDTAAKDNMSRPDYLLSAEGASKEVVDRLEAGMKEKFQGPRNAGKFLVTSGKMTATPLQWEIKELGTPTRLIEEIAAVSGVPVPMLLSADANRLGGEGARLQFYRTTVHPDCVRDEQKLNQRFIPRFAGSEDYFVCYDHVSFEDRAAVTKEVVALVSGGILSPNEGRQELGFQDAEGADFLYPPAGNTGGSASVMGDLSPQQNDERQDRKSITHKAVARMPQADTQGAREESALQFKRDVLMAFLKDGTVNDVLANMTRLDDLMDEVGLPRNEEYKDGPYLPVVSTSGPVVNGTIQKDTTGDIVGGGPGDPPPEQITVTRDASAGDSQSSGQGGSDPNPQSGQEGDKGASTGA